MMRKLLLVCLCSLPVCASAASESEIEAAITVASTMFTIERVQEWCASQHPANVPAVIAAKSHWNETHDTMVTKAGAIVRENLAENERAEIFADLQRENERIVNKLAAASAAERTGWCANLPEQILSGPLNLAKQPALAQALAAN